MPRYFIEVAYKGTNYNGFQIQQNANTIQAEVEKALFVLFKTRLDLTGSSRTDVGVHALQNFFHLDTDLVLLNKHIYNLNAILPSDIILKNITQVAGDKHCRFTAESREYKYFVYTSKNPFLEDRAYYYPYKLDIDLLHQAAAILLTYKNFAAFSKKHTQVNNFICNIFISKWIWENDCLVFNVKSNRFLRGMVRALVATMLKVGRGQISIEQYKKIIESENCASAFFDSPAQGLFLVKVDYEKQL